MMLPWCTTRQKGASLAACVLALALAPLALSQAVRNAPGFRSHSLPRNDDGYSGEVPIGFTVNFFGRAYSTLYVNNNGNVTFKGPLETFVPFGLAHTEMPIIAAFFADVDTRHPGSEPVTYGAETIDGHKAFGVNYFRAGYYNVRADRLNTFQLILIDRSDTGPGNFDIEFNYAKIGWDLGDAGRGRGDVAAVVGFSNGTGQQGALFELAGSMRNGALLDSGAQSLIRGLLNSNVPGRYVFQARSGTVSFLRITTPPQLPDGTTGQPYSAPPLAATGGTAPYSWATFNWLSDLGLTLDSSTGSISGTPTRPGTFNLAVQVSDRAGTPPAAQTFTLTVGTSPLASLVPILIEPGQADIGSPVKLVAGLRFGQPSTADVPREVAGATTITATIDGQTIGLRDDGQEGDQLAGDGRFTGNATFHRSGPVPVTLRARSSTIDRSAQASIQVYGRFVYRGGPVELDLGTLRENSEACKPLALAAEQHGEVPFRLQLLRRLPAEHRLELRARGQTLRPDGAPISLFPGDKMEICLVTDRRAPSSEARGEPWLELAAGASINRQSVELKVRWRVDGLNFWQRWWWLFALILAILLLLFIIYGYVKPHRFTRGLALTFVPEFSDLDDTPQPLAQWRGVRIGFYRDARAYLHSNYRVSGDAKGAIAVLTATADGAWVAPGKCISLFRELEVGEWQEIQASGRPARRGIAHRVGEQGPYFRLASSTR